MREKYLSNLIREIVSKVTGKHSTCDDAGLDDLSYEDALLDVEIRSFMRAEYGKQEPPGGILPRILGAIRAYRLEEAKGATAGFTLQLGRTLGKLGESFAAAIKLFARPEAGRMLSGSLLTGLLVLAALPGIARSLSNGGGLGFQPGEHGPIAAEYSYQESTGPLESGTSTSAAPQSQRIAPVAPVGPGAAPAADSAQTAIITPGRLYDDPRLMLAQRIGEDPNQLKPHAEKQQSQGNYGDGQEKHAGAPDYKRPIIGQY